MNQRVQIKVGQVRLTNDGPGVVSVWTGEGQASLRLASGQHSHATIEAVERMCLLCPPPEDLRIGDLVVRGGAPRVLDALDDETRKAVHESCVRSNYRIVRQALPPLETGESFAHGFMPRPFTHGILEQPDHMLGEVVQRVPAERLGAMVRILVSAFLATPERPTAEMAVQCYGPDFLASFDDGSDAAAPLLGRESTPPRQAMRPPPMEETEIGAEYGDGGQPSAIVNRLAPKPPTAGTKRLKRARPV